MLAYGQSSTYSGSGDSDDEGPHADTRGHMDPAEDRAEVDMLESAMHTKPLERHPGECVTPAPQANPVCPPIAKLSADNAGLRPRAEAEKPLEHATSADAPALAHYSSATLSESDSSSSGISSTLSPHYDPENDVIVQVTTSRTLNIVKPAWMCFSC